jgi:hypothetical protein
MNAPLDHRALYAGALDAVFPGCHDPEERDLRCRLLTARDVASANLADTHGHVQQINLLIVEAAGHFAFADADNARLRLVVEQCRRLMACAAGAELLEAL